MAELSIEGRSVAHAGSEHTAPGPPAVSGIMPPVSPPSPTPFTPAPFLYIARSAKLIPSTASRQTTYKDKKICKVGTCMDIEAPGNQPAKPVEKQPPNGADLVSKVSVGLAKVTGPGCSGHVVIKTAEVVTVGADVVLNIPTEKSSVHQSQSKFLAGPDLAAAWANSALSPAEVVATGDPVAVASGEVIDEVDDFVMRGVFELSWKRVYGSGRARASGRPLGHAGWSHAFDQWIEERGDQIILHDESGRPIAFPGAAARSGVLLRSRGLTLTRTGRDHFEVRSRSARRTRTFAPVIEGGPPVLTRIRDDFGNFAELVYESGRLARVFDTARREARLTHDAQGRITRVELWARDEARTHVAYGYSDDGDLASVTNALGEVTYYTYDAKHRMVEKRMRSGLRFSYVYDPETGRCVESTGPNRLQHVALKAETPRRIAVTGNPEPRELEFDARGNLLSAKIPGGAFSTRLTYDDDELVVRRVNAAGDEVKYTYDDEGRLVVQEGPGESRTTYTYFGDLLVAIQDGDRITELGWDHRGALQSIKHPDGVVIHYEIDRNGRVLRTHGPEGPLDAYAYDAEHNLITVTDARGAKAHIEYDALGLPTRETDSLGRSIRITYDALGRPTRRILRDGTIIDMVWDADDNIVASSDAHGTTHTYERAGTGGVVRHTMPDGQVWERTYDMLERIREIRNPKGELYEYRYDRAGRVIEERTFDGQTLRYAYSRRGMLSRIDYDDGTWVELEHDARGRLTEKRSPHGTITFERDAMGRDTLATVDEHGGAVVVETAWNERGQLVQSVQDGLAIQYTYDAMGRVATRTLPGGHQTRYTYDPCGVLVGVEAGGETIQLQRDVLGRERRMVVHGSGLDVRSEYDDDERLTTQIAMRGPTMPGAEPTLIVRRDYTYGPHARLRTSVDSRRGATTYGHDALGQLTEVRRPDGGESYAYDASGALVQSRAEGDPWVVRMGNLLVRTEQDRYEYDVRRRRRARETLRVGRTEYVWDCNDRLREAKLPSGVRVLFKYDAYGRRVRKTILTPSDDPTQPPKVRTVRYLWDFAELAMEIDSERGERSFVHEPRTFRVLLQVQRGATHACVSDRIGVPKELIDGSGRVAWAADHTAWGAVIQEEPTKEGTAADGARIASPFGLLGHYRDEETGLAYAGHRYFDPSVGRWLSADPLGIVASPNLFAFDGSPTERVDPLGLYTRSSFQAFLEKYHQKRIDAQAAAAAEQSAIGDRGRWVSGAATDGDHRGRSGTPRPPGDPHRPEDRNIHAEEQAMAAAPNGGAGSAVGAGRAHCANCTDSIIRAGGVPATSIRPSWNPEPWVNKDGGFTD